MTAARYLASALMLFIVHPASADVLVTTEEYPPFNMNSDGQIIGIATDLVRATFEKAAVPYKIEMYPWQRAYAMALENKDTCVYSTTETDERRDKFEWVGPMVSNDWVLFARADRAKPLLSLDDAGKNTIGGYTGDAIAVFLESKGFKVDAAPRDELNPAKLVNGRIDYWATGLALGKFLADKQGINDIVPVLTFKKSVMSLACNKQTDSAVLAKLRSAFEEVSKGATKK